MHFSNPLIPGQLIKRYKRFLADILLDTGELITAHCANSGALLGCTTPGLRVWVSYNPSPTRKLNYSWQIVEVDETFVGVNTSLPNQIAEEAIIAGLIPELRGYEKLKREVKYGQNSRIDIYLTDSEKSPCYVEVKNVHLKRETAAEFPDSVTTRGTKHLHELEAITQQGARAVMLYIVQRNDCSHLTFAKDLDPTYAQTAARVLSSAIEPLAYSCHVTPEGIHLDQPLKLLFS